MKIGINLIAEPLQKAGTGRYAFGLLSGLADLKDDNKYYVFVNKDNKDNFYIDDGRFKYICLDFNARSAFIRRVYEQVVLPFVLMKYKLDLLHSVNNLVPILWLKKSCVMVLDVATWGDKKRFVIAKRIFLWFYNIFSWTTIRFCPKVLTISEFSKSQIIQKFRAMRGNVKVIYIGVEKIFRPVRSVEMGNFKIKDRYVYTWSSIERSKNLERLFEAFSLLDMKNLQLVVSGKKSNYWQEIVNKIDELGLGGNVIMTGYVNDKDLVSLINGSEFVIFPTLYEGAGLPGIEAMACGKAVAASSIPAVREYCGKAALYFDPYKVHEMVKVMKTLLEDTKRNKDFAQKGLLRSKAFDWKSHATKTQKIWETVS